jgi:hypothetical protein
MTLSCLDAAERLYGALKAEICGVGLVGLGFGPAQRGTTRASGHRRDVDPGNSHKQAAVAHVSLDLTAQSCLRQRWCSRRRLDAFQARRRGSMLPTWYRPPGPAAVLHEPSTSSTSYRCATRPSNALSVGRKRSRARAPTALSAADSGAYSRSSWRTQIQEEHGSTADNDTADSSPAQGSAHEPAVEGSEGEGLTATQLRVRLSLAEGSGRLDLTDGRLSRVPPEVFSLPELEVRLPARGLGTRLLGFTC